jgi:hypothetical protein
MAILSPYNAGLIGLLRSELPLSETADIKQESTFSDDYPILFDLIIDDGGKRFVIDIKRIVRLAELSKLGFLKQLLTADRVDIHTVEFVIVGKRITAEAKSAAEKTGIRIVQLPAETDIGNREEKPGLKPVKITAVKSWQVIFRLLKVNPLGSIRQLAMETGVSYGWVHATVRSLMEKGIVSDMDGLKVTDLNKLLNGVAWERPFERLFFRELHITAENPIALAQEIGLVCAENNIPCAFTSFTAGEIYTQYSVRHDSVYVYIDKDEVGKLASMFDLRTEGGIAVRLYTPDRDVFRERRVHSIPGVPVVSPSQALLDCAGLGYVGRDLTVKLVGIIGVL